MSEPFYKYGLRFSCRRCSFCCGHSPGFVYLSKSDLLRLCGFLGMNLVDFAEKFCRWAGYYEGKTVLALKEKKNYDCILWSGGCSAYDARPVQCSTYPFWSWMLKDRESWDECAKDCPGMNSGKLWTGDFIEGAKKSYDENVPLTREEFEALTLEP